MPIPEAQIATLLKQMVEHYVDVATDSEWFEELVDKKIEKRFSKTKEKANWLGTDTDMRELLAELANGEYTPESFNKDVEMAWEEKADDVV